MKGIKPIILLEDDEVDVMTVQRALNELHVRNRLIVFQDGEAALKHFNQADPEIPCIILLDLNMPRMGGVEFLKAFRKQNKFNRIPVVVLTTSGEQHDILQTYDLGISGYMVKPMDFKKFVEMMRTINLYWTLSESP
jgi:CheY-like chemotaxis protein